MVTFETSSMRLVLTFNDSLEESGVGRLLARSQFLIKKEVNAGTARLVFSHHAGLEGGYAKVKL